MSQQINLFNPIFLAQKKQFSVVTMAQGLGLIILGSLVFYGYALYQVDMLAKQSEETSKRFTAEQARLARFQAEFSPEQSAQQMQEEITRLQSQLSAQSELLETLKSGVIGNTEGYSSYLKAFARQAVPGLWLTGFEITGDGSSIMLAGATQNPKQVPAYISRLKAETVLRGKAFAQLEMSEPAGSAGKSRVVNFALHSDEIAAIAPEGAR